MVLVLVLVLVPTMFRKTSNCAQKIMALRGDFLLHSYTLVVLVC
jgi:hypothetical protein